MTRGAEVPLRQESTVEIGTRTVRVVTYVVLEPEAMLVTEVLAGTEVLKKSHAALPSAAASEVRERGPAAVRATLQSHHLRYLRAILARDDGATTAEVASPQAGVLGTLVLDGSGEVTVRSGEEQVPGGWLRAAYLLAGLADVLGTRMDLGGLERAVVGGKAIGATISREARGSRVVFVDPAHLGDSALGELGRRLRELTCLRP